MFRKRFSLFVAAALTVTTAMATAVDYKGFTDARGARYSLNFVNGKVMMKGADGNARTAPDGAYKSGDGQVLNVRNGGQVGAFNWGSEHGIIAVRKAGGEQQDSRGIIAVRKAGGDGDSHGIIAVRKAGGDANAAGITDGTKPGELVPAVKQ